MSRIILLCLGLALLFIIYFIIINLVILPGAYHDFCKDKGYTTAKSKSLDLVQCYEELEDYYSSRLFFVRCKGFSYFQYDCKEVRFD